MVYKYLIRFEVDAIKPKSHTISVSRKKGISTLTSELEEDELLARQPEVSDMVARDLTRQGLMLFNSPIIKSIKPKTVKHGSGIKALKKLIKN